MPGSAATAPLENGDRLTRCEFERRYAARPDLKKAQLIEGIVYMPSPVSLAHSGPHAMIQGLFFVYSAFTPGVRCDDNAAVRLDHDNEPQPDVLLRIEPEAGGGCRVSDDEYRPLPADDAGVVHSRVFPGLGLAVGALLEMDLAGALAEAQKGIGTAEHEAFVARLAAKREKG